MNRLGLWAADRVAGLITWLAFDVAARLDTRYANALNPTEDED